MTTFVLTTTVMSTIFLFGFIVLSTALFGLQSSYSAYASKWKERVPIHNMNLWSIVTIVSALLLVPTMIERGEQTPLQFLGFIVPIYLIVVGLTPDYEKDKFQGKVHTAAACICAMLAFLWLILIVKSYIFLPVVAFMVVITALSTGTFKSSMIFWGEMIMFFSIYLAIFFS